MVAEAERVLRDVFRLNAFRPGQAAGVEAMLGGRDVLSVAPTGSGKSISYWVPAVVEGGLTMVVSPLIALMKDQVDRLRDCGVAATFINSSVEPSEQRERLRRAIAGDYRLLFLAPERLGRPGFMGRLADLRIRRIVVDEAHCISTWGHDFRPDYRLLSAAIAACGRPPVAGFTATATPQVRTDIASSLGLRDPFISVSGFNRPALTLAVIRCRGERAKRDRLRSLLGTTAQQALVYVGTVSAAEELAAELGVACYHGRQAADVRRRIQDDFTSGRTQVVVATSAFGMGVDIAGIRRVIHYHVPGSLESYYQGQDAQGATEGRRSARSSIARLIATCRPFSSNSPGLRTARRSKSTPTHGWRRCWPTQRCANAGTPASRTTSARRASRAGAMPATTASLPRPPKSRWRLMRCRQRSPRPPGSVGGAGWPMV